MRCDYFEQLNKCVVVCDSILQMGNSGDGVFVELFKYECMLGHLCVLS